MKLHERPVDRLEYDGRVYRLTLSFDRVFRVLELFADDTLFPADKVHAAKRLLVRGKAPDGILEPVFQLLFGDNRTDQHKAKTFDFAEDAGYIYAGFRQAYGIDLHAERGRLHWHEFLALFAGLPDDTRMAQIMAIRARPIPAPTKHNTEQRAALIKQKQAVALKTAQTDKKQDIQDGLRALADRLRAMAQGS